MALGPHSVHPGFVHSSLRLSLRLGTDCVTAGRRSRGGGPRELCDSLLDSGWRGAL